MTNDIIKIVYPNNTYELIQKEGDNGIITINKNGHYFGIMSMSSIIAEIQKRNIFNDNLIDCDKYGEITEDNKQDWGM